MTKVMRITSNFGYLSLPWRYYFTTICYFTKVLQSIVLVLFVYSVTSNCTDRNEIFREHSNCCKEEMITFFGMIGSVSLILKQFFNYVTIEINAIIYLIP